MPFTGFKVKFPEYEVITPQTGLSYTVRSLTVAEEERMKASMITPTKVAEHLNKCIYEAIVKRPPQIKDFKTFLQNTTLKDRDALLYGLYHVTYEDIRNYDVRCTSCRKEYPITVKASQTFSVLPYPGTDVLTKRVKVDLPVSKGVSTYIKQPTLEDEAEAIRTLSGTPGFTLEAIAETLVLDRFEQDIPESTEPMVVSERSEVIEAYRSLPALDKRAIYEKYNEEFGKYGIDLKFKSYCIHCGNEEVTTIDLVENFFRMVYSS
jgi:hypothetical protein